MMSSASVISHTRAVWSTWTRTGLTSSELWCRLKSDWFTLTDTGVCVCMFVLLETEDMSSLCVQEDVFSARLSDDHCPDAHLAAGVLPHGEMIHGTEALLGVKGHCSFHCVHVCVCHSYRSRDREYGWWRLSSAVQWTSTLSTMWVHILHLQWR